MSIESPISYKKVDYATVQSQIGPIMDFSTDAFMRNHEITRNAYEATDPRHQHEFIYLFKESVADMVEEIHRHNGSFFVAEDRGKMIGLSMGRPYGKPALSQNFMQTVSKASSKFGEVMKDWWRLMEKFQASPQDAPPSPVYHQAMTAVHPDYAAKGIGTKLAKFIMKTIPDLGFVALARENSSTSSDGVMRNLKKEAITVIDVDSVRNEATGVPLTLRLQLVEEARDKADGVAQWFFQKKK